MPIVDVRDVAQAHLAAIDAKPNTRYLLCNKFAHLMEVAGALAEEFKPPYKVPQKRMPKFLARLIAPFNKDMKGMLRMWGKEWTVDNSKTRSELGIEFQDMKTSLVDMVESLIEQGYIPEKRKEKLG